MQPQEVWSAGAIRVAIKKPTSSTLWGVVIPWLVIVGIKVAATALF